MEHRRRPCGSIMLVDLIIITVGLLLCEGWSRLTRCPKSSSCVASCNFDMSIDYESVSADTDLHPGWLDWSSVVVGIGIRGVLQWRQPCLIL